MTQSITYSAETAYLDAEYENNFVCALRHGGGGGGGADRATRPKTEYLNTPTHANHKYVYAAAAYMPQTATLPWSNVLEYNRPEVHNRPEAYNRPEESLCRRCRHKAIRVGVFHVQRVRF